MGNTTSFSGKLLRVAMSVVMAFSLSLGYSITQAGGVSGSAYAAESDASLAAMAETTDIATVKVNDCGDQFYTGKAIEPYSGKIKTANAGKISEGTDFTVTYANNIEKGTATATLTGINKYTGTLTLTFKIVDYTLTLTDTEGNAIGSLSKDELAKLAADSTDNTEAVNYQYGTNVISVPAKQYVTMAALQTHFNKAGATKISTAASDGFSYTYDASIASEGYFFPAQTTSAYATDGAVQVPDVLALTWASEDITSTAAAAATAAAAKTDKATTVRGLMGATVADYQAGQIAGKRFVTNVTSVATDASKQSIEYIDLNDCGDQFYTGKAIEPFSGSSKTVNGKGRLTEGKDYTVTYANNIEKGTATATITGMGDYAGTYTKTFKIVDYTLTLTDTEGNAIGSLSKDELAKLAADSTDNTEAVNYQYGTNVISVPAKQYVTIESLLNYVGQAGATTVTAAASDGFSYTYDASISRTGYFFPAQTTDAYAIDGAVQVPAILTLQWASAEITSTAAAAAQAAAASTDKATTVRSLMGVTAEDYAEGNFAGKRFVTNVTSVTTDAGKYITFHDADYSQYYGSSLNFVSARGLMVGYPGTQYPTFGVGQSITRAEFATILWRYYNPLEAAAYDETTAVNETSMSDIEDGHFYTAAANWAVENGYINGIENADGTRSFAPHTPIPMEQLVAIIGNIADENGIEPTVKQCDPSILAAFTDTDTVSTWAKNSVAWGVTHGIVHGYDNINLRASEEISRERAAVILTNAIIGDDAVLKAAEAETE